MKKKVDYETQEDELDTTNRENYPRDYSRSRKIRSFWKWTTIVVIVLLVIANLGQFFSHSHLMCPDMDFLEVATKWNTDKVVEVHVYNRLYEPYMHPVRCNKNIRILEIGLGCDMWYGPGASMNLWLEYFPYAEIYFIEYNQKCAEEWDRKVPRVRVFHGDQANRTFLNWVLEESGGNFDFIVDDGGHMMFMQKTSLEELFKGLKPGGTYFIEDLLSSFPGQWDGHGDSDPNTTLAYIKNMTSDLMSRRGKRAPNLMPLSNDIWRIDCIDEMCAFTKNDATHHQ